MARTNRTQRCSYTVTSRNTNVPWITRFSVACRGKVPSNFQNQISRACAILNPCRLQRAISPSLTVQSTQGALNRLVYTPLDVPHATLPHHE